MNNDKVRELTVEEFKAEFLIDIPANNDGTIGDDGESGVHRPSIISAGDLLSTRFPTPNYAVDGLLPEGLTVLVGKPKVRKSWLVLGIAVSVASGGKTLGTIPVAKGDALYLALEDGQRRLQHRLAGILNGGSIPERLSFATDWRRLGDGGLEDIEEWLKGHPEARLIVIDTLQRIRPPEKGGGRLYAGDYDAIAPLGDLAKRYGVAVVVVHHTRKQDSEDPLDLVSGSNGLTGAADGVLVLKRSRGQSEAELFATGRDFDEVTLALRWDNDTLQWISVGDAAVFQMSEQRRAIIDVIQKLGGKAAPKAIAQALGKPEASVRKMLFDMKEAGQLTSDPKHNYFVDDMFGSIGNNGNGDVPLFDGSVDVTSVTGVTESYQDKWKDENLTF